MYKLMNMDKNIEVDKAYVDGYSFGDRLLEGVIFEITINKKGNGLISKCINGGSYFEDLNTKKWLAEAKKYVLEFRDELRAEVLGDCLEGDDVELVEEVKGVIKRKPVRQPIKIDVVDDFLDTITKLAKKAKNK